MLKCVVGILHAVTLQLACCFYIDEAEQNALD